MIAIEEGRYGTAEILAEEALKTLDGLPGSTADDREARVRLRSVVEDAVVGRGDLHRARALVDRRLEEVRAHGPGARGKMLDLVVAGWDVVRVLDKRIGLAELTGDLDTALTDARTILEMGAQRVSEIEELGEEQDFIPTYLAGERARLALLEGRYADAVIEQRAAMDRIRERNEALMEAQYVAELARMQLVAGDAESAASTASDAVALADERSMPSVAASARFLLAEAERRRGRPEVARTVLRDALADPAVWKAPHAVRRLETVAGLASDEGSADVAVRLLAAADAARERMGMTVLVHQAPDRDDLLARMRAAEGFDEAWAEGSALSLGAARQEAAAYVRG
jgi:tetratricopeptide (TPR) repeat protein